MGVTGHRLTSQVDLLTAAIEVALDRIQGLFPGHGLRVCSPIAEGADRLVAQAVLERGGELIVPLPMPVDDYATDFETETSRAEFRTLLTRAAQVFDPLPPVRAARPTSRPASGWWNIRMCSSPSGMDSAHRGTEGTAEIVAAALSAGKIVCHIWAGNHRPDPERRTSAGKRHGTMRWANLSGQERGIWQGEQPGCCSYRFRAW
ncbi:MAG: hypothetical protein KBI47_18540 [Armatimonadetes bacterium]|nr:hypothetical protein [Armatimonadota bacterium]